MRLPKLIVRVRFPSPAPTMKAQVKEFPNLSLDHVGGFAGRCRAINVQLADWRQHPGRAVIVVSIAGATCLNVSAVRTAVSTRGGAAASYE
jgi:hypothetical protein